MTDVEQVLRKVRELIQRGWTRGAYKRRERYCLYGALDRATVTSRSSTSAYWLARHAIEDQLPQRSGIVSFNDAQRSKKPVLELIDRAIAAQEANNA